MALRGGGVQASKFGEADFDKWVEGEGQDPSGHLWGSFFQSSLLSLIKHITNIFQIGCQGCIKDALR